MPHLPVHIPLPKSMTVEEVEVIQERLNREATAKGLRQGLTLVHFSAQPEPFLTKHTLNTP